MPPESAPPEPATLRDTYLRTRASTVDFTAGLAREDFVLQSMPDASPIAWHLAHTTWFFEEFVVRAADLGAAPFHPCFGFLFNSYYEAVGARVARARRGLMSRPTVNEILAFRAATDERVAALLERPDLDPELLRGIELGIHHEQQHQELMATDLLHAFAANPLAPAILPGVPVEETRSEDVPLVFVDRPEGLREIGVGAPGAPFHFDNEGPRHRVFVGAFALASRPVTNAEWLAFMKDGGYRAPSLWLSDGWARVQGDAAWSAPLHWRQDADARWVEFTPLGEVALDPHAPVRHVSQYEADAYARWAGARLPTEAEWEVAAAELDHADGTAREDGTFVPRLVQASAPLHSMRGGVWEWTSSPYTAYPGYRPADGALGEYNGKFMSGQMVLRGGSCATPRDHVRTTYRNFFPPSARWQFSGLRLARDAQ
ncbi:MAG: ergothioneine biosynthesis protein EgtB [Planctomycetota bacterium]